MTRWFVGVRPDGQREVFSESDGVDPVAAPRGYAEVCGPYTSERDAAAAAKHTPSPDRANIPKRRRAKESDVPGRRPPDSER